MKKSLFLALALAFLAIAPTVIAQNPAQAPAAKAAITVSLAQPAPSSEVAQLRQEIAELKALVADLAQKQESLLEKQQLLDQRLHNMFGLLEFVQAVNSYLSDYVLMFLLVATGLFFSVRTRFIQLRCFGEGLKRVFGNFCLHGGAHGGGMSSFQAFAAAVAAQVGTGNIVGASGAILIGGPGAIFWMWIIAFFGMATIYAEAIIAQETRIVGEDGTIQGGPVYYIRKAFNKNTLGKFLSGFFAVAIIISLGFIGLMVQANSIGETCSQAFGVPSVVIGCILVVISLMVFSGGVSRIASVTEKLVPLMAILYIVGGIIILVCRAQYLAGTFGLIFKYAFAPEALLGGSFGMAIKTAISQGVKRGLFSNEAGMGSTPHAHAVAVVDKPHDQGCVAMIGVFLDTFIVLTMTALIVICTLYFGDGPLAGATGETYTAMLAASGLTKTTLVQAACSSIFGNSLGNTFVAVCLLFFAYSTILSWSFFGRINFRYLFGKDSEWFYTLLCCVFVFLGTITSNELVWELQDMFNQMMVLPNVLALFALSGIVVKAARPNATLNK